MRVTLSPGRERPIRDGHPWVFSGAIQSERGDRQAAVAEVFDSAGGRLGSGFYSADSQIRVRLLAADPLRESAVGASAAGEGAPASPGVGVDYFERRLRAADSWRQRLLPAGTSGYRLLNAEGDGLPGWTIDRFGSVLVSQVTSAGLEKLRGAAYEALGRVFPGSPILHLGDLAARREEGLPLVAETISGPLPREAAFEESGLHFVAELEGGQKTGFYCDQRDNRRLVESFARDRRVLDLFSHSGAFSLYALRGRARTVTAVESAGRLHEIGLRLVLENHLDPGRTEFVTADVFEDLRRRAERKESYDLVVCDPPPLAKRRTHIDKAARAYKDLNRLALGRLAPGGLLLTFSCSGAIDSKLFRQILFAAAVEARVDLALLAPLAAAVDHPVSVFHPQGEYLKGWLGVVRGPLT
ncbi:MAG: rRNA (cytosine1962-C5)-methyltransferase [Acidobacteriota bacterium]|nr:rRNA (cytosine1962-C5)-methyltransferase [Acidobacteriota bacterium]